MQNDFFDDLIDDEAETETESSDFYEMLDDADDAEDDEDDLFEVRTALLMKKEMIALLSLKITAAGAQIVRIDPRDSVPSAQRYEDSEAATHWFQRSLATSRKNGWNVIYDGTPLLG